ncbi:hypothetical protein pb186bvf_008769 [Paramecium bursaria]
MSSWFPRFIQAMGQQYIFSIIIETINRLEDENLQYLNISYPNFHQPTQLHWGLDFPQIVDGIKLTIDKVVDGRDLVKILLIHDWGAVYGYLFDLNYPKFVDEIVALDVGCYIRPKPLEKLMIASYQLTFAAAFILTFIPIFGTFIATLISTLYMRFILRFPPPQGYSAKLNYPYYYYWKSFALGIIKRQRPALAGYVPSVPLVFIYGEDKPFHFHSEKWRLVLSKDKDSEFIGLPCGHWIMRQQNDFLVAKIKSRLKRFRI